MRMLIVAKDVALVGGTANSLITILDNLPKEIEEVFVLLPARGTIQKKLSDRNISTVIMEYEPAWTEKIRIDIYDLKREWNNYLCAKRLAKFLTEKEIDIVYTNSGVIDVGAMAAWIAGKRHVWHHREFIHKHFEKKYILEWKTRFLLQHAEKNILVSKALHKELKKRYHICNGVVLYNKFSREKYYIKNNVIFRGDKLRCIVTGMMYEKKHQMDAIMAVYKVLSISGIPVELTLVGNCVDTYRTMLKKNIIEYGLKEYVHIISYVENITELRKEHDIEISCSEWEGFGRNIIEAMLGGLFVIGAASGATKELIKPYKNGLLYDVGDINDLANKILWVWENRDTATEISKNAQKWALRSMTDDGYADRLSKLLISDIKKVGE